MIKVLIVDDSEVDRKIISLALNQHHDIEIVGVAKNPYEAKDLILILKPDVITLDLNMPGMDGITFLSKLMKHFRLPVIIVSAFTPSNSKTALSALNEGAMDVILKPGIEYSLQEFSKMLGATVRESSEARYVQRTNEKEPEKARQIPEKTKKRVSKRKKPLYSKDTHRKLIAIGSSTGGTRALEKILKDLPADLPGIVIVQHMPAVFTKSFSDRLNTLCEVHVKEGEDGEKILPGSVYIAPGDHHMEVKGKPGSYRIEIRKGEKVRHQRPSVDVLFNSVAYTARGNATGLILTGMGSDGAEGLLNMRLQGAYTMGQDEKSCVVYGMPRAAYEAGAVTEQIALNDIAKRLTEIPEHVASTDSV